MAMRSLAPLLAASTVLLFQNCGTAFQASPAVGDNINVISDAPSRAPDTVAASSADSSTPPAPTDPSPPSTLPPPLTVPKPPVDPCATNPVIKVTLPVNANQALLCATTGNANDINLLDIDLTAVDARVKEYVPGRAMAFANLTFQNTHTSVTHYWASTLLVGNKSFGGIKAYRALGDDICPGGSRARAVMGAGSLTATQKRLTLTARSGANPCTNGSVRLASGTVTLYIAKEQCADKHMRFQSQSNYRPKGFIWPTTMYPMISLAPTAGMRSTGSVVIMAAAEGSTPEFPGGPGNTCGAEVATVAWRIQASNTNLYSLTVPVPASQGMSHVVIGRLLSVPSAKIGSGNVELEVGRNFGVPVFTGAYAASPKSYNIGEAFLGLVHLK